MCQGQQALYCQVDVIIDDQSWPTLLPNVESVASELCRACVAAALRQPQTGETVELCVVLASDRRLRQLNRRYRGFDRPTNVLSFANLEGAPPPDTGEPKLLGDVLIARETAEREAQEDGKSLRDHVSHLIVHGTLHLLGFSHEEEEEADEMEALERRILASFDIADPYAESRLPQSSSLDLPGGASAEPL